MAPGRCAAGMGDPMAALRETFRVAGVVGDGLCLKDEVQCMYNELEKSRGSAPWHAVACALFACGLSGTALAQDLSLIHI